MTTLLTADGVSILTADGVSKSFGGLIAVDEVSLATSAGELLAIVGPNGSGKSTLLNLLSGVYRPDRGRIQLAGERIDGKTPSSIASAGLTRTFQNPQVFASLTVLENVLVGRNCRLGGSFVQTLLGTPRVRREEYQARELARALLDRVGLPDRANAFPNDLSYGQRRLLEVARALAADPRVVMLDEPAAGLAVFEAHALSELIRSLSSVDGVAVIVVEHNMRFVMGLADRVIVLNFGRKIADGSPTEIRANDEVIDAYLGRGGES